MLNKDYPQLICLGCNAHIGNLLIKDILKLDWVEGLMTQVKKQIILDLLEEKTKITAEIAYRLSCYFQVNPELFLNLQQRYDLKVLEQEQGEQIKQVIKPYPRKEISRKTF